MCALAGGGHAAVAAPETWTIARVVEIALAQNTRVRAADEAVRSAEADARRAHAGTMPRVDATIGYQRVSDVTQEPSSSPSPAPSPLESFRIGSYDNTDAHLEALYPLWNAGHAQDLAAAARLGTAAAGFDRVRERRQIAYDATAAAWEVVRAEGLERSARTAEADARAHARLVTARVARGMAIVRDRVHADLAVTRAELAVTRAYHARLTATAVLLSTLALPLSTEVTVTDDLPPAPDDADAVAAARLASIGDRVQAALAGRPDMQARTARRDAAARTLDAARADRWPAVSLRGTAGYAKPGPNKLDESWDTYWTVGVTAQWPLFDGGVRSAQIEQARAARARLDLELAQAATDLTLEITRAHLRLTEAEHASALAVRAEQQAAEDARVAEAEYQNGRATSADVLDAERAVMEARDDAVRARADQAIALANWTRATATDEGEGGGR